MALIRILMSAYVYLDLLLFTSDNDAALEMILTIPTDANGRSPYNGARFVAMEMTSTDEIFEFRTQMAIRMLNPCQWILMAMESMTDYVG